MGVITNGTAVLGLGPELAKAARPDCIIATGGSDFPNQVNNVLCCPYIFLGALVCGAAKRVLRAAQVALDEGLVHPILIGRPAVSQARG